MCRLTNVEGVLYELDVTGCEHPRPFLRERLEAWDRLALLNAVLAHNRVELLRAEVLRAWEWTKDDRLLPRDVADPIVRFYRPVRDGMLCNDVDTGRRTGYVHWVCDDTPDLDSTSHWLGVSLLSPVPATVEEAYLRRRPPAYRLSESPDREVLVLRPSGGLRRQSLRYRLFGDGRLLREVLEPGRSSAPVQTEEVRLPRWRVLKLFDAIVRVDMISPGNRTVLAGLSSPKDGAVAQLTLDIEEVTDETGGAAALHETVTVPSPHINGRRLPQLRVLHVFLRILQMLDAPFERRAAAVLSDAG